MVWFLYDRGLRRQRFRKMLNLWPSLRIGFTYLTGLQRADWMSVVSGTHISLERMEG